MSPKLRNFILTVFLCFAWVGVYAQKGPPPPDTTKNPTLPGLVAPIDDHLVWLIIAGIFIGFWYVRKKTIIEVNTQK